MQETNRVAFFVARN